MAWYDMSRVCRGKARKRTVQMPRRRQRSTFSMQSSSRARTCTHAEKLCRHAAREPSWRGSAEVHARHGGVRLAQGRAEHGTAAQTVKRSLRIGKSVTKSNLVSYLLTYLLKDWLGSAPK